MRQRTAWDASRLARLTTLAACAAVGITLAGAGSAPAATEPDLAVDPTGNASFAWMRSDGSKNLIQERRRSVAGTLSEGQYLSGFDQNAAEPQVAVAPNGTATFVWYRTNGTNTIVQTRSRAPGGALSEVQNLSATGQGADSPQVAVDSNGRATFVWRRNNGTNLIIQARRRLANGTLEATQSISGSGQSASFPQVAVAPSGNASFVWQRFDGAVNVTQARRRLASGAFQGVQNLSSPGQNTAGPQVAVDKNDNASFVWRRADGGDNFTIQDRRRLASGTLEPPRNLAAVAPLGPPEPQVAVDPTGNASFVWTGTDSIQARRRFSNGTLEATQDLSPGQFAFSPQLGVAPDGAATFVWRRLTGTSVIAATSRRLADLGPVPTQYTPSQDLSATGAQTDDVRVGVDKNDNATFAWERAGVIQTRLRTSSGLGSTVDLSN